jgi:hypothetical protein
MPYKDINTTLTDADRQAIKPAIATIQAELPFLVTLSLDERKRLYKMGSKRLAFVQNSLHAALKVVPTFCPPASTYKGFPTTTSLPPT